MPLPRIFCGRGKSVFVGRGMFEADCKYNWLPDKDQWDWNKLCGVSLKLLAPKNQNAVMIAWRFNPLSGLFDVVPYFNENKRVIVSPNKITVTENEVFEFTISQDKEIWSVVLYSLQTNDGLVHASHSFSFSSNTQLNIHSWVGGANNEEGQYGGAASQDMTLWYGLQKK